MSKEEQGKAHIHPSAVRGFSDAANYHKARLGYTRESVEFLLKKVDLIGAHRSEGRAVTVFELGCGTGKFTRIMLDVFKDDQVRLIASDPLESMYRQFKEMLPNVEVVQCPAQAIALSSTSVDVVLAAESVHWFASFEAFTEINRVLAPGGRLGIISIIPDTSQKWVREMYDFLLPLYRHQAAPNTFEGAWKEALLSFGGFSNHNMNDTFGILQECSIDSAYAFFTSASGIANAQQLLVNQKSKSVSCQ